MTTLRPKNPTDLSLAPVAAAIDRNLQRLRDLDTTEAVFGEIALELNALRVGETRGAREDQILRIALRDVDLHGWLAEVSEDATRIHLHGGSVTLDVGLSATLERYIAG